MITNRSEWISNGLALVGTGALALFLNSLSLPSAQEAADSEPPGIEVSMATLDAAPPADTPLPDPPKDEEPPPEDPPPPEEPPPPEPEAPPPVPEASPEQTPEVAPAPEPPPQVPEPPKPPPPKPQTPPKPQAEQRPAAERAPVRSTASAAASLASAFRACLAAAPYPQSKDARLQKPSGIVGISISAGAVTITSSSGSQILDQAARSRALSCAEAAGAATLSGLINYIPR